MSSVRIILDNHNSACYPGQTIAGKVVCNFDKLKKFRAVRIKFKGKAETEWYEDESYYDSERKEHKTRRVRYYADEIYFNAEYNLVQGGDNFSLGPGTFTYPFSYILPAQLPSSYEGSHGNIRYHIKATIDRPWKFDYEDTICLNLVSPLDLNYLPELKEPVHTSVDKTMCSCWCNDAGVLTFNMSLPARGFVSGQEVSIGAHVENTTNVSAECVKFEIAEDIEFIAHYPSTRTNNEGSIITACREGGIGAHGEKSWTSCITIPTGHYPNLKPCSIINIDYTLKAKVVVPCPHSNLKNYVSITIGTVPLAGVTTTFPGGPPPDIQFPFPSGPVSDGAPLLSNISAPPYPAENSPFSLPEGSLPYPPGGVPNGFGEKNPGGFAGGFGEKGPSGNFSGGYGEKSPSAPPGDAPYPAGGLPYPPGGASAPTFAGASAPPTYGGGSAPYPPNGAPAPTFSGAPAPSTFGGGSVPYPPSGAAGPYPPVSAPATNSFGLPSYEETQKLNEKNGKPE